MSLISILFARPRSTGTVAASRRIFSLSTPGRMHDALKGVRDLGFSGEEGTRELSSNSTKHWIGGLLLGM